MQPLVGGSPTPSPSPRRHPWIVPCPSSPTPSLSLNAMRPTVAPSHQPTSYQPWAGFSLTWSKSQNLQEAPGLIRPAPHPLIPPESFPAHPSPFFVQMSPPHKASPFCQIQMRPGGEGTRSCRALENSHFAQTRWMRPMTQLRCQWSPLRL